MLKKTIKNVYRKKSIRKNMKVKRKVCAVLSSVIKLRMKKESCYGMGETIFLVIGACSCPELDEQSKKSASRCPADNDAWLWKVCGMVSCEEVRG